MQDKFDINPLVILIKHSDLVLRLFDKCKNNSTEQMESKILFEIIEKHRRLLFYVKLEEEKEMADLDLFWFSYTGYHWNDQWMHVIGCTHDKQAIKKILPWRDVIIHLLNKFHQIRYKGGCIKLFKRDITYVKDFNFIEIPLN